MDKISTKPKLILIIDDDEDDRQMFLEALEAVDPAAGYVEAQDGEDALQMLRTPATFRPDFIFLDLNMPRKDGKQCLTEIKQMEHLQHIPVIIYTTSKHPRDVEETKNLGAVYYITKPFQFDNICASIRYVLTEDWK